MVGKYLKRLLCIVLVIVITGAQLDALAGVVYNSSIGYETVFELTGANNATMNVINTMVKKVGTDGNTYVFIADGEYGIDIFRSNMTKVGNITPPNDYKIGYLALVGDYLYAIGQTPKATATTAKLMAYNVSDPNNVIKLGANNDGITAVTGLKTSDRGIAASGNVLCIAGAADGVRFINITDRGNPVFIKSVDNSYTTNAVSAEGNYAYAISSTGMGFTIFDISNPGNITLVSGLTSTTYTDANGNVIPATGKDIAVSGNFAATTTSDVATDNAIYVHIIDISNKQSPKIIKTYHVRVYGVIKMAPKGLLIKDGVVYIGTDTEYKLFSVPLKGISNNNIEVVSGLHPSAKAGVAAVLAAILDVGDKVWITAPGSNKVFVFKAASLMSAYITSPANNATICDTQVTCKGICIGASKIALTIGNKPSVSVDVTPDGIWEYTVQFSTVDNGTKKISIVALSNDGSAIEGVNDEMNITVDIPPVLTITDIACKNGQDPVNYLQNGSINVTMTVKNNRNFQKQGTLLGVLYKGKQLKQLVSKDLTFSANESKQSVQFDTGLNIDGNSNEYKMKIFVVDNVENLVLLSDVHSLLPQVPADLPQTVANKVYTPDVMNVQFIVDHGAKNVWINVNAPQSKNQNVTLLVLRPGGQTFADADYIDVLAIDNDGKCAVDYQLKDEAVENMDYLIKAAIRKPDVEEWYQDEDKFRYYGPTIIAAALNAVKESSVDSFLTGAIVQYNHILLLDIGDGSDFANLGSGNQLSMYQRNVLQEIAGKAFESTAVLKQKFIDEINKQKTLKAVNDESSASALETFLEDTNNARKLNLDLTRYNHLLTSEGKEKFCAALIKIKNKEPYSNIDTFKSTFDVMVGITLINITPWQSMEESLRTVNDILGLPLDGDYSKLENTTEQKIYVHKSLLNRNFETVLDIQQIFNDAVDVAMKAKNKTTGTDRTTSTRSTTVSVSSGSGTNIIPIPTGTPAPVVTIQLSDIDEVTWAKESIVDLISKGIVTGYPDNTFRPNNKITREEFLKLAMSAFGLKDESAECTLNDVKKGEWYYPYIANAQELGIVKGRDDETFGVGVEVTRQEMAVLTCRVANIANIKLDTKNTVNEFKDENYFDDYAVDSIKALQQGGIIVGDNGYFSPFDSTTRAMAVKTISKLLELKR